MDYLDGGLFDAIAIDAGRGGRTGGGGGSGGGAGGRVDGGHGRGRGRSVDGCGGGDAVEVALDLGDAVVGRKQTLPVEALEHRADARSVHQLQHEQMRLQQ